MAESAGEVAFSGMTRREFLAGTAGVAAILGGGLPNHEPVSRLNLRQVKVEGEFGRRISLCINANILRVDVEGTFLRRFRDRSEGPDYLGFGKFIDALVRLAAYSGDERLLSLKKRTIGELIATQDADGYIGVMKDPASRIRTLWDLHENSYIIWALVSDYQLFGDETSLNAARKMADRITKALLSDPTLRPDSMDGVIPFSATNLGLDRALVSLSAATGEPKYREFVIQFLKLNDFNPEIHCGPTSLNNHAYSTLGHALAQLDLYRETGNSDLLRTPRRVVDFLRRGDGLLVTGSCSESECWHDTQSGLQNTAETCTGVYLIRLMDSLLQLEADSLYGDIMERAIYNAIFAAVTPDGRGNHYFTPFDGPRFRDVHGDTFCCPNNLRRFFGDLPGWIYYRTGSGVIVNLYNPSTATVEVASGLTATLQQETDYPTTGDVQIRVEPPRPAAFEVQLRIPRWCREASIAVNGGVTEHTQGGCFYTLKRQWQPGDRIELKMPMPWRFVVGRKAQSGRIAILRGPQLFTLNRARNAEVAKHPAFEPRQMMLDFRAVEPPLRDDSVRPQGVACRIKAWQPGNSHIWPFEERVPLVLTEFPDAGGEAVFFLVNDWHSPALVHDELVESPALAG